MKSSYLLFAFFTLLYSWLIFAQPYANQGSEAFDVEAVDLMEENPDPFLSSIAKALGSKLKGFFTKNKALAQLADEIETLYRDFKGRATLKALKEALMALRAKYEQSCVLYNARCMDLTESFFFSEFPDESKTKYLDMVQGISSSFILHNNNNVRNPLKRIRELTKQIDKLQTTKDFLPFATQVKDKFTKNTQMPENHILTDVDDTLFASSKGGMDKSYPDSKAYPGVTAFHDLLSKSYSTLLSARPNVIEFETRSDNLLRSIIKKLNVISSTRSLWDFSTGIKFLLNKIINTGKVDYARWAKNKFLGFAYAYFLNPDKNLIFIGDNGQGDLYTAILIRAYFPQTPCLIHDIKPDGKTLYSKSLDKALLEGAKKLGVILFENYADAASSLEAFKSAQKEALHINLPADFSQSLK